ncbi:MAG: RAQPRD family integrative conjugative element protein [Candidatus Competibacteraceae bacterium]|nr:RAQPRD family integrative conjugative element protein [Candidatus Competibacteraceae bacterium]
MRATLLVLGMLAIGSLPLKGTAGDGEREALARLVHELDALEILIRDAEAHDGTGWIRFQYGWLRDDLARMRLGILEYLRDDLDQPRTIPPLRGDYRR